MEDEGSPFAHIQDVLGQSSLIKTYTVIALGYTCTVEPQSVVKDLHRAADQLVRSFPYLAGHVVRRGAGPGRAGLAMVVPYPPSAGRTRLVVFRDCTGLCQPLETIVRRGVPMEMLDGEVLSAHRPLPDLYDESEKPAPVLEIQANFVDGGLILAFQGNHTIMDMNGLGQVIRLYAKALRGEAFSDHEVEQGNRDRREIVKLLGPDDEKVDMSKYRVQTKPDTSQQVPTPGAAAKWVYLHFPAEKLAKLKEIASKQAPGEEEEEEEEEEQWVSTDDALSAFLCTRITTARLKRMEKAAPEAIFCRAINGRRPLGIPAGYMGHLVWCVRSEVPVASASATTDFGSLARQMRADLRAVRPVEIRSFATALAASEDKGALSQGAGMNTADGGLDLMLSSWAGLGFSDTVFGGLGRPVFGKRPRFSPLCGLLYLMPRSLEGHVDVACCLSPEDIDSLARDEEFAKYATCLG